MATTETFEVGDKVKHPKFGQGTVKQRWGEADRLKVLVKFGEEFGEKKLLVKVAKMKKVAPAERPALAPGDEASQSSTKALGAVSMAGIDEDVEDQNDEANEQETDEE